jgi:hypothetical protein
MTAPSRRLAARVEAGSWRVTLLPLPKGLTSARALGFGAGGVLGVAEARRPESLRRCLWVDGRPEVLDGPAGFEAWHAGDRGLLGRVVAREKGRAALAERGPGGWSLVDLHPAGFATSVATAGRDGRQVGYGQPGGQPGPLPMPIERGLLWSGTAASVVELRGPDPARQTRALAIAGDVQVGEYGRNWSLHAALWRGTPESMVDLHPTPPAGYPPEVQVSTASGAGDGQQVGTVSWKKTDLATPVGRAALWTGTAASFVDLTPARFEQAWARACARGFQVGWATRLAKTSEGLHAVLWNGAAEDFLDLHTLLPKPWNRSSAEDVAVEGRTLRVLGTVSHLVKESIGDVKHAEQVAVWEATLLPE